jgi:hypothetical protein
MKASLSTLSVVVLAGVALIVAGVISATGHVVPAELWTICTVLVGAVAGVAVPQLAATSSPAPAPAVAPPPIAPAVPAAPTVPHP